LVYNRRMSILADIIAKALPEGANVLDVGCGDGKIDSLIKADNPSIKIEGIDIFLWNKTYINVTKFDGKHIPFGDNHFDFALFIDVLHHAEDPSIILKEALRVTKQYILIKDHVKEGVFAEATLSFMDYVGNKHNGIRLPYNYLDKRGWEELYKKVGLKVEQTRDKLNLFPFPENLIFDRKLHFFSILSCNSGSKLN